MQRLNKNMPNIKKNVVAIIQARIGSKRLPAKVVKPISFEKTPIEWIMYRLSFCNEVDKIVLSTSDGADNDPVQVLAEKIGLDFFRGSESDLVSRIYHTAKMFKADAIVRITADCPLVDPKLVDEMIKIYRHNPEVDYVTNVMPRTYPHGLDVEIVSFKTLERLFNEVNDPIYREIITTTIMEHPDVYKIINVKNHNNLSEIRLTLDYPEDFTLISKVFEKLYQNGKLFCLDDLVKLFKDQPDLLDINRQWVDKESINSIEGCPAEKFHFIKQEEIILN